VLRGRRFQNLSGDPQQEYFADGMVEEIITTLSRLAFMGRAWDRSGWLNRLQAAADGILAATVRMWVQTIIRESQLAPLRSSRGIRCRT